MKNYRLYLFTLLFFAVACKKEGSNTTSDNTISNAQAADIAATTLAMNSSGFGGATADASVNAQAWINTHVSCGSTKTDSTLRQSPANSTTTYSYKTKYSYTLNCNSSNQPDNAITNLTYSGNFDGPRLSSTNSGSSLFTMGGLSNAANIYIINGEYKRSGSFQSKVENKSSATTSVDLVVKSLIITKATGMIASGTATISINGTTSQKGAFSYNGTLVFNGDGTAALTLNGTVYTINLATGESKRK